MALSPDGRYFWDGQAWRSALSPDGRHRWVGTGWVAVPQRPVLRPTSWTAPLQRATAAFVAVETLWGLVIFAVLLTSNALSSALSLTPSATATMTPAEVETFRQTMQQTLAVTLITGVVAGLAWNAVIFAGCLRLWRWVFWYQLIVGLFAALGLVELPALIAAGLANVRAPGLPLLPTWTYAVSFVLDGAGLGLAVWMLVALRRCGAAWARVREPAA